MATSIEISEQAGVCYLHFGSHWIQGAMRIARPHALELQYTRDMMLALLLRAGARWPRRVLLIGLGAASLTKFLYRNRPRASLVIVEIEPDVVSAARQFFKLPDDPKRVSIEIGDGHDYVAKPGRPFDLILVDGFDAKGRAGMLDMLPFYCNARARLSEQGPHSRRNRQPRPNKRGVRGPGTRAAVFKRGQQCRRGRDRLPGRHRARRTDRNGKSVAARHRTQSAAYHRATSRRARR
jgi:spermidine synthase